MLREHPRDEFTLSTKVGRLIVPGDEPGVEPAGKFVGTGPQRTVFDFSGDAIRQSVDESLERLGLDRIDILFIHDPDEHWEAAISEAYPALAELRAQGVVRAIGAGMNQAEMLTRFVREADFDVLLCAGRYTLLDQVALDELLPACVERHVSVVIGGVMNSGLLADPSPSSRFNYAPPPSEWLDRALRIKAVCDRHDVPLRAAAIQFPLAHPAVASIAAGVRHRRAPRRVPGVHAPAHPGRAVGRPAGGGAHPRRRPTPAPTRLRTVTVDPCRPMPILPDPTDGVAVRPDLLRDWTAALVGSVGTPDDIAADVAEILVAADRRGIPSHGTARLPNYLALVSAGVMDPAARPVAEVERAALVRYDARNGWGHHACRVAMDRAIEMARTAGSALVVLRNSNHYGIAGWYALRAAAAGMIGMSLSNTSPLVAPTRARVSMLGTNPIAVAAPAGRFGALCLDMATSTIPRGRIEVAARRGENASRGLGDRCRRAAGVDARGRARGRADAARRRRGDGRLQGLRARARGRHADRGAWRARPRDRPWSGCSARRRRPISGRRSGSWIRPSWTDRPGRSSSGSRHSAPI